MVGDDIMSIETETGSLNVNIKELSLMVTVTVRGGKCFAYAIVSVMEVRGVYPLSITPAR